MVKHRWYSVEARTVLVVFLPVWRGRSEKVGHASFHKPGRGGVHDFYDTMVFQWFYCRLLQVGHCAATS